MTQKRIMLILPALCVLLAALLLVDVPRSYADDTWRAKYWNNKNLAGDPVLVRQESEINHDWRDGSPSGVNSDNFSARWKRTINLPAGSYRFTATMDDGIRVWVDNALIIDSWINSQVRSLSATVPLVSGDHEVKVEYYEDGGEAVAKLRIDSGSSSNIVNWRGEYFNNTSLSGTPALVRDDERIDFDWGDGSPAWGVVGADNFSVRWTRAIDLTPGRYRWTVATDDGVRLWVNGRLIIDKWYDQSAGAHSAEADVSAGLTDVRMEYYENVGGASARLSRLQISDASRSPRWQAEYFNNKNLSGTPALKREDRNIDYNWGNGSPDPSINSDNFSVRWKRSMYLEPGRYRFTAVTDDGVRLWINGQLIINQWVDRKPTTSVGEIVLPGGTVDMKMEYFENVGGAKATLSRLLLSTTPPPPPATPTPTGTVPGLRLNLRSGPAVSNEILRVLAQGETVTVLGRNVLSTWIKVQTAGNVQGWVYAPLLQMNVAVSALPVVNGSVGSAPPAVGQTAAVSNAIYSLNVRSGPGTNFEPITTVGRGQIVELLGRDSSGTWLNIRTAGGNVGWSSARYLDTSYLISSLPVTS